MILPNCGPTGVILLKAIMFKLCHDSKHILTPGHNFPDTLVDPFYNGTT